MRSPVSVLPPPVQPPPPVPSPSVLVSLPWSAGVWSMYEHLLQADGRAIALNYLTLQYRLDTDPTMNRVVRLGVERLNSRQVKEIAEALTVILHPYQQPLSLNALLSELGYFKLYPSYWSAQHLLNRLIEDEQLQRYANPFRGNTFVYCSALYKSEPAIGDRVIELIRKRSHRSGIVERFKIYRMDGKLYPVIRWQNGMLTFGNPEMLVVIDRPEPFSVQRGGYVANG